MRSFFAFLAAEGTVTANPTEGLTSPRVGKTLPRAISPNEVDELLEQPARRSTPEAKRDRAMLELMYATGMRVTELVSLDVDSLHLDPSARLCALHGQGREGTHDPRPRAGRAKRSSDYLEEGRPMLVQNRDETALFVNRRGERLTRQGFWLILKGYAKSANLEPGRSRRTRCATRSRRTCCAAAAAAQRAGDAGARQHLDDAGLHASRQRPRPRGLREGASTRLTSA